MNTVSRLLKPAIFSLISVTLLLAAGQALAQDSIENRLNLPRLKLQCDPFIPVGTIRLNKEGQAKRDKFGNVIFDPPSSEEIKRQRAECTHQQLYGKIFRGKKPAGEVAGESSGPDDTPPPPPPTIPVLIGPPDNSAYYDPAHDMWFGMIWDPVPGADVHILCITSGDGSMCPTNPGLALGSSPPGVASDVIQTPNGRTTSVYEMPEFCYTTGRCMWSIAACNEVTMTSVLCEYASPFWRVRVTD